MGVMLGIENIDPAELVGESGLSSLIEKVKEFMGLGE